MAMLFSQLGHGLKDLHGVHHKVVYLKFQAKGRVHFSVQILFHFLYLKMYVLLGHYKIYMIHYKIYMMCYWIQI